MWNKISQCWFKFFGKPIVGQKRSLEDSNESPPCKQMKLDHTNFVNRDETFPFFKNPMTSRKNIISDEDDCVVDKSKSKWDSSPTMARRAIRRTVCEVEHQVEPVKQIQMPSIFSSHNHKDRQTANRIGESKEIEYDGIVRNSSSMSKHNEISKRNLVANRIFNIQVPSSLNRNDTIGSRGSIQTMVKKKVLQETYKFQERFEYLKLLQLHATDKFNDVFRIRKLGINNKSVKSSIPVIDLTKEKSIVAVDKTQESVPWKSSTQIIDVSSDESVCSIKTPIQRVNSLEKVLRTNPVLSVNFVPNLLADHSRATAEKRRQADLEKTKLEVFGESNRKAYEHALEERLSEYMRITSPAIDEVEVEEEKYVLPELTDEQEDKVSKALCAAPAGQILVENFGLQIKRRDVQTLKGLNWLNDEVINFYMNLIMERGKIENMPKVYAFNTFFYPKLLSSGHSSLKRWTKKVDIFSHDMVLVPVHLGMHWCMSVMDFRKKQVRYYDSMGSPNDRCLQALLSYLEAESLDKRKTPYDTGDWEQINVDDIPQQMNGSDCGVFSCMFAEHLARDSPILFTQDDMPYFRRKMVLEILETKLLT